MRKVKRVVQLLNNRGSALLSVFLVIIVLLVLGMGILSLSLANSKQAVSVDTYERSYYVADAGAKQGVEQLKSAALEYYRVLADEVKNNVLTNNNAVSFFAYMDAIAYTPPQPDASVGGPTCASVSISHASVDSDTHRYTILSIATDGRVSRKMSAFIDVTFEKIKTETIFEPFGSKPLVVGNTIDLSDVKNKTVLEIPDGAEVKNMPSQEEIKDHINPPENLVNLPETRNLVWNLAFSQFSSIKDATVPTITPINGDNVSSSVSPFNVIGVDAASYEITNVTANGGFIYCSNANNANDPKGKKDPDWGLTISNCTLTNVMVVCAGNITINSGTLRNVSIYCGKTLTIGPQSSTNILNSMIYASDCEIGRNGNGKTQNFSGLIYVKDDLTVNANKYGSISGQCVTRGSAILSDEIPNKKSLFEGNVELLNNLPATLNLASTNPFMSSIISVTGGPTYRVIVPPTTSIYTDASYTESGS